MWPFKKKEWVIPKHHPTSFNLKGPVPDDISWKDAWKFVGPSIVPMHSLIMPTHCFDCGKKLIKKDYDWWDIEDSGQYMVWTMQCPNKCGAYVECA